jgi:polysaccharide biosynthesis transport protein
MKDIRQSTAESKSHSLPAIPPQFQPSQPPEEQQGDWNAKRVLSVLKRRWHIVSAIAILVASYMVGASLAVKPQYQGQFRLLVEPVNANNDIPQLATGAAPQESGTSKLDYDTQIQVLQSPELIEKVVSSLRSTYPDLNYGAIVGSLSIIQVGKTKILLVGYQGTNPIRMQAVLEQLTKVYLEYSLSQRQTNLRQGIQFVEKQLPISQQRVDDLQRQLQAFRQQNFLLDPDSKAQQISGQITEMNQRRSQIDQALTSAKADLAMTRDETGIVTTLNQATRYQQLMGQLREIEVQIAEERTRFSPQSLTIQVLEEKRSNLIPLLQQEARQTMNGKAAELVTRMQTLQIQRDALDQAQIQVSKSFQQLPGLSRQYTDLQRELQVATESLSRFLVARETLQIQASQSEIPWQVVEPATVVSTTSANRVKDLMTALAIGVAVGLAGAILLEQLANTYQTVDELKQKIKLPILGQVPFQPKLRDAQDGLSMGRSLLHRLSHLVPSPVDLGSGVLAAVLPANFTVPNSVYDSSEFVEALRILYANLQLRSLDQPVQSVIVSSAESGDGKTTIAVQLAQAVAAMGKRVLLVDADLRRPSVHTQLQLENRQGLFEVITDSLPVREVLQSLPHLPLCKVLVAGQSPNDPAQILASKQMHQYMAAFQQTADLIIYDAPPLDGLADASLLAPYTDGILFVIGLGKTNRSTLAQTLDSLKISRVPILGLVCNSLNT